MNFKEEFRKEKTHNFIYAVHDARAMLETTYAVTKPWYILLVRREMMMLLHIRIIVQRYRTLSHVSNIQERGCIAILLTLNLNRQHSVNGA
jgi:hypothetical protein